MSVQPIRSSLSGLARTTLRAMYASMLLALSTAPSADAQRSPVARETAAWETQAQRVTIYRDQWGIAHVYGASDADAVFGMIYAQAEDDFPRIERNYVNAMGRLAEIEGEREIWRDLRMKLFIDTLDMKRQYAVSPAWLKALMDAWANGLNYYLHTHPEVRPQLLRRFEPWMALTFSEGSIGGDIESINLRALEAFYSPRSGGRTIPSENGLGAMAPLGGTHTIATTRNEDDAPTWRDEPGGSNGFAIAPKNTANGHALLMINPHTSFYFRPEIHMASTEGLDAYGAVTWGQFFIYQGFNARVGWMHTSGGGDVIDEYRVAPIARGSGYSYRHGTTTRPVRAKRIGLPYKTANGMASRTVTAYFTHHGPVVRGDSAQWIAVQLMQEPLKAIQQSYLRTKARDYASFRDVMNLRTNSSNNTVYADADGTIAYFHGNFIPKRDTSIDFTDVVDGGDPHTDWQGLHALDDMIALKNPASGWLMNTNNWPFTASGASSPRIGDWPVYMSAQREDNARGVHAVRVLNNRTDFRLESLIAAAYDSQLPAFEQLLPPLVRAHAALPDGDRKRALTRPVATLAAWDLRFGVASVAMTLADAYGTEIMSAAAPLARDANRDVFAFIGDGQVNGDVLLAALERAVARLERDFGSWQVPWGDINRFQRLSGDINAAFDDSKPSLPVAIASATWGSLAAYGQTGARTTKKYYGNRGNSFVAAVEFGPRVRAKSVLAGGVSNNPDSPAFFNQGEPYATGTFKDVNFYRDDVERHADRSYRPGERSAQR